VSAQSASPLSFTDNWQVQVTPYLWGSGLVGQVGIGDRTADVDASFRNILDHLHFAAMGLVDARRDKLIALSDILYTDLRGQQATPGPLFSSVNPQQKLFILTPEGGYRVLDTEAMSVDVLGGIRWWHMNAELQFQPGLLPGVDVQASRNWVDGIAGARARHTLARGWWVSAYGDLGAGGSTFTYQLVGTAGLDIHERFALVFGYRYLDVNYSKDIFLLDTTLKGPFFGFTIKLNKEPTGTGSH
jgi:hypothetical protein